MHICYVQIIITRRQKLTTYQYTHFNVHLELRASQFALPFYMCSVMTEIYEKVITGTDPPFRPVEILALAAGGLDTHVSDLIILMEKCWDENPTERPSISQV